MLSTLIVTKQKQSADHGNKTTTFKLDSRVYRNNFRLIDVGATVVGATGEYPHNVGVAALIDNWELKSGSSTVLSSCTEVSKYAGYHYGLLNQDSQRGILARTMLMQMGTKVSFDLPSNTWSEGFMRSSTIDQGTRNVVNSTNLGYIRLNDLLKFFNSTPYLAYIPDLKLVINWADLTKENVLNQTGGSITSYTILRPILVYDEIVEENVLKGINPNMTVRYTNVEADRFKLAKTDNNTDLVKFKTRVHTFDGTSIQDFTMAIVPDTDSNIGSHSLGQNVSMALYKEQFNLVLNGQPLLGEDGINSPAMKMLYNKRTNGALARNYTHFDYSADQAAEYVKDETLYQVARQAYTSIGVEDKVNTLDLVVHRQGRGTVDQDQYVAADIFIFSEVNKFATFQDGQVITGYA